MKWALAIVAALALAVGGWWYASPILALDGLRDAVESGDEAELERHVDFPAFRENLSDGIAARIDAELADQGDNPMAGFARTMAQGLAATLVDQAVTPEGMRALVLANRKMEVDATAKGGPKTTKGAVRGEPVDWRVVRGGFERFRLVGIGPDGNKLPDLIFARDGLGWKLSGIDLESAEVEASASAKVS